MSQPWEGFWQVLSDDAEEEVITLRSTTIALREMGVAVYTAGHFVQVRAGKDRRPGSEQDEALLRRKTPSWCGSVTWREAGDRWIGRHGVLHAQDVRIEGSVLESTASFDGDDASVRTTLPDGTSRQERWRRLSAGGSHPLAGAWESRGGGHWLYLVTAGHYAVMHALDDRAAPDHAGELDDQEFLAMVAGYGVNAGAHVSGNSTLDHWPIISGGAAGYEARKHPSFRYRFTDDGRLELQLPFTDYEGVSTWRRAT